MNQALSLHIGLNYVDPSKYDGWDGQLSGCINDANAMKRIAESQGFSTQTLIDSQATAAAVTNGIASIGRRLQSGDFFLLTYSGHGGQLVDDTGEEVDGLNETWVLWDRQFLDNEIYNLLGQFSPGVRVFVSSDSCHSGTVLRAFLLSMKSKKNTPGVSYAAEFEKFVKSPAGSKNLPGLAGKRETPIDLPKKRAMPENICINNYEKNKDAYNAIRSLAGSKSSRADDIKAGVIYISGCADNQFSYDGATNGAFTTALLQVWNNGSFSGSYPSFYTQVRDRVNNPEQVPQYMKLGTVAAGFENAKPYVTGAGSASNGATTVNTSQNPSMSATTPYNRTNTTPPTFQVNKGANPYYYVELSTDPSYFVYGNTQRNNSNWYATWAERLSAPTWQMPGSAWNQLKNAQRIFYRVGSTSNGGNGWDNLLVSFYDSDVNNAPFIELQNSDVNSGGSNGANGSANGSNGTTDPGTNGSVSYNSLNGSVGNGGVNRQEDVMLIQQLLNEINDADGGSLASPLQEDGRYGTMTLNAIRRFQTKQEFVATGLVKQNSSCLHMLLNKANREA
ncbi:hypothetical protein GCM10023091_23240 [Ravibacter arvi]|uniref:Uncharacterized protein n=1 Tax=Ravibacter arvi TaxID=2051041 RepID=A0ABP8LY49_9BACT